MPFVSLAEIKERVTELAAKIGAKEQSLPTYGHSRDFGSTHIEVDHRGYHFVVVERGKELKRLTTTGLDDLLFFVFETVAAEMASSYQLPNKYRRQSRTNEPQDHRRLLFAKQLELLAVLSTDWATRKSKTFEEILRKAPFDDNAGPRTKLCKELRNAGHSGEEAWARACEKYPLPLSLSAN